MTSGIATITTAAPCGPTRRCPACDAPSAISSDEDLWPPSWACPSCGHAPARSSDGFPLLSPLLDPMSEGIDLENFSLLQQFEERSFWFVSRNELIEWLVRRYAPATRRALELGCGTGYALTALRRALPTAKIAASELHSCGLVAARTRHGDDVELIQLDARECHLVAALDLVGAFDVLEHIPDDEAVLAEIGRTLAPGGVLIATVPQHPWMWSRSDEVAHHQRRYRVGELARKAEAAGLEPLYETSFTTLSFPVLVAARVVERLRRRKLSLAEFSERQYGISRLSNQLLLGLARLEHTARRLGLPMPMGGSQVLVARRLPDHNPRAG